MKKMKTEDIQKEIEKRKLEKENTKIKIFKENQRILRINELDNMPWIVRLQEPEFKEQLIRLEKNQKEMFPRQLKKHYPSVPKEEYDDLFAEFFTDLLSGKCISMADFMKQQGHERHPKSSKLWEVLERIKNEKEASLRNETN